MKSSDSTYDYIRSFSRIDGYLDASDLHYEETKSLPEREKLTFSNGFYAWASAMFVDIRDSSSLPDEYTRPRLAKLYRSYISEVVAVMDGNSESHEISIVGDGIWGVFNTPYKPNIDSVFSCAAQVSSLIDVLNCKLRRRGFKEIKVGIGLSYGRVLMIKAGFTGSGINEVVYMGDAVNQAAKLAAYGNASWSDREIMVSSVFQQNLKDHNKNLLTYNSNRGCYHGNVVNSIMNDWYKSNCQ